MRILSLVVGPAAALVALAACGGSVTTSGSGGQGAGASGSSSSGSTSSSSGSTSSSSSGSTSSSSSGSTSSSSGSVAHGDCQSDADCNGGTCTSITPGGYKVCVTKPVEATSCQMGTFSQCCSSADCGSGGKCYPSSDLQFCGGAAPPENGCVTDACQSDADCGAGKICTPAGAFGLAGRACMAAFCKTDADCKAAPGGACLLVGSNPCCSHEAPAGLGCVYPGDCTKDADCPGGSCTLDTGKGVSACGPAHSPCPP